MLFVVESTRPFPGKPYRQAIDGEVVGEEDLHRGDVLSSPELEPSLQYPLILLYHPRPDGAPYEWNTGVWPGWEGGMCLPQGSLLTRLIL